MMVEFCVQRRGDFLSPLSASDQVELVRLPERRILTVTAEAKAPEKLRRWYWACVQLLVEATGRWPNKEIAHKELLMKAGYFESMVISTEGDVRYTPQSVAGWGFVEWREYIDRLLPIIIENYAGETRAEFRNRVDAFLGIKLKEAWEGK